MEKEINKSEFFKKFIEKLRARKLEQEKAAKLNQEKLLERLRALKLEQEEK